MDEKRIERRLVEGVQKAGGLCLKFISPGRVGVPDRVIISPAGRGVFAEVKTETGKLSKRQEFMLDELRKRNADVRVLCGLKDVESFLQEVMSNEIRPVSVSTVLH